jgi:hypothetical protein
MPVVGMLNGQSADSYPHLVEALRLGLKEADFVEGQNVLVEYRWAEGRDERLPAMAVDLVNREVAALVTGGSVWATIRPRLQRRPFPLYSRPVPTPSDLLSFPRATGPLASSALSA